MPARAGTSKAARAASGKARGSRATPSKKVERQSGRYTPPIPRTVRRSPRWYPWVLLSLLVLGVLAIILNYTELTPASPSPGYVVGGIVAILVAAMMATRYR